MEGGGDERGSGAQRLACAIAPCQPACLDYNMLTDSCTTPCRRRAPAAAVPLLIKVQKQRDACTTLPPPPSLTTLTPT